MEQIQYQPTPDRAGGFRPVTVTDRTQGMAREMSRMSAAEQQRLASLREKGQQEIRNAEKVGENLLKLSEFSETLSTYLKAETEKRNEREKQEGIMLAYTEGVSAEEQAAFEQGEEQLRYTDYETQAAGAEYERVTGDGQTGERIRNLSGWKAYGYAMGLAQRGGAEYGSFYEDAKNRVVVNINGEEVTYATAKNSAERAAVEAQIRQEYLDDYIDINPALLNKYLFPQMQAYETKQFTDWTIKNNARIAEERALDQRDSLYAGFTSNNAGQAFYDFIQKNRGDLGYGGARKAAIEELTTFLQDDTIPYSQREAVLEQIKGYEYRHNDGRITTLGKAFGREFGNLEQTLTDAEDESFSRKSAQRERTILAYREAFEAAVKAKAESGEKFTNAEIAALKADFSSDTGMPAPSFYDEYTTADEEQIANEKQKLDQIRATRGYLIEADLDGMSIQTRATYNSQVKNDKALASPSTEFTKEANKVATAGANEYYKDKLGDSSRNTLEYEDFVRRANDAYNRYYRGYIEAGESPEAAHEKAIKRVRENSQVGTYSRDTTPALSDRTTPREYSNAKNTLKDNPTAWRTTVIPGTEQSFAQLKQYADTGVGSIPRLYSVIADSQRNATAWDIADAQLKASGHPGLVPGGAQAIETISPEVEELLKFKPTPSRTMRAAVSSTGGKPAAFLNMVASVESASYGGYDAYNLGGSDGGHTAHGSGNSSEDMRFGKPISQLTIQQVMNLQAQGKLWAAGRYQFTTNTLRDTVADTGLDPSQPFDADTQDLLALSRALWRMRVDPGVAGMRREWIGLAHVPAAEIQEMMQGVVGYFNQPHNLIPGL